MKMTGKAFVCVVGLFVAEPLSAQVGPQGSNVVEVGLALRQVDGVKRVLMIGAHPDDEDSSLLATLARGMGVETAYLSPTWSPSSRRSRRWPPSDAPTPMHIKFLARGTGSAREAADYLLEARDATGQLREGVEVLQGDPHRVAAVANNPASGAPDLEFADWQVIDLAGAVEHPDLCDAAFSYLLERMRLEVEDPSEAARFKLMVVDEAWRYLQDPAVLNYLAEAAKTWRKKNAALILATQSGVDVTSTPGAAALLESIPTKLFLANPELPDEVGVLFRLNDSELAQVRGLIPKRELYLRRPDGAAVLRLEVDPESYWLYTSSALDAEERARAIEVLASRDDPTPNARS